MKIFGIIDILRDYCAANGIVFLYGSQSYRNAIADRDKYQNSERVMIADFRARAEYSNTSRSGLSFAGIIGLGQVREENTRASIDEMYLQKYDRRLKDLAQGLEDLLKSMSCNNDLDITSAEYILDINKMDINADFVICNITLEYE